MWLVHFEKDDDLQHAVETVASRWSVSYERATDPLPHARGDRRLLVMNLAALEFDPLAELAHCGKWGIAEPNAFAYCAHLGRGAVFGNVQFYPPPLDIEACAQRLLGSQARPPRVLLVGEAFETMNAIKNVLAGSQGGISMAFDARQAIDLVPMLKPELILIDLNMPRGEALRLAVRLCATRTGSRPPLAFFWTEAISPSDLRDQALRAIRDTTFSADDLARALSRSLAPLNRD